MSELKLPSPSTPRLRAVLFLIPLLVLGSTSCEKPSPALIITPQPSFNGSGLTGSDADERPESDNSAALNLGGVFSEASEDSLEGDFTTETAFRSGQKVMTALAKAYPDRLGKAEYKDGDWTVVLDGTRYFFAGSRILPENQRSLSASLDPMPFYVYPEDLPAWKVPGSKEARLFQLLTDSREAHPPRRSMTFLDHLWRAGSEDQASQRVKTIRFLGRTVNVHYAIMEDLALVEERIQAAADDDPAVRAWILGIGSLDGWNWRRIADTKTRSYHAYGLAVDIVPKRKSKKASYWLWANSDDTKWWEIPYSQRENPPLAVIKAFESQGFVWGGKWHLFDTMHFEYRPEILILNGIR